MLENKLESVLTTKRYRCILVSIGKVKNRRTSKWQINMGHTSVGMKGF